MKNKKNPIVSLNKSLPSVELTAEEINALCERMKGIVFRMYRFFPFWGLLAENCKVSIVKDSKVPTACVDRYGNIQFGAKFFQALDEDKSLFVLAHEIGHAAFSHIDRRQSRDPFIWNVAIDYAINALLNDNFADKKYLPEGVLLDQKYEGMSAEEIYESLIKNAKKVKTTYFMSSDLNYKDDGDSSNGDDDGDSNSEEVTIRDRRAEKKNSEQEWDNAISLSVTRAKMQGDVPDSLDREVSSKIGSKINWTEALKQYLRFGVSRILREQYSFMPPNRRFIHRNIYLPSMYGHDAPKIGFAVDTSGSMGEAEISVAIAEIDEIRKQFNCPMYIVDCDSKVHSGRWISPSEDCPTVFKGGGGTDFRPVFEHLQDSKIPVDIMVYLTDGYGEFGEEPEMSVLWITTTNVKPPYGEHIQVNV